MATPVVSLIASLALALPATMPAAAVHAQQAESFAPGSDRGLRFAREPHAASHENVAMLRLASTNPDHFLDKMLMMNDGRKAGRILSIERNREDKLLYMIIQGEPYFQREVEFAVPTLDVNRFMGDKVVLNRLPGGFLRGFEYKAAEFQEADTYEDWPLVVND